MYWTEVKRALLYGQPVIRQKRLQPQLLQAAIRDILRLIACGWIEAINDEAMQRIQSACQTNECQEMWDEFQCESAALTRHARKARSRKSSPSRMAAQKS
jgi:hypothetical protein